MSARVRTGLVLGLAACQAEEEPSDVLPDDTGTLDLSACEVGTFEPELFLGKGVGGAFEILEDGAQVGLSAAPQGGFGVSVLIGTRGLQAGADEIVTASVTAQSEAVANSAATFELEAALQCKSDGPEGPQGIIYGVVVGFSSSLTNTDLLTMNGQPADLDIVLTDAVGTTASVTHTVTLIVGE